MSMKLHQDVNLFKGAIRNTAQQLNIPPEFVEKDYWVTYALHSIFRSEIGQDAVFKGGTALLKCFNLIERFSEDIDLVVLRRKGETDSRLKSKLKAVSNTLLDELPEIEMEGITHKMGMIRKTAHGYEKLFGDNYIQVRDVIVLESTWLGHFEPSRTGSIVSFVGNMMLKGEQTAMAKENGLLPFEVRVLEPTRTMCEKIMSLVRFSYGERALENLKKKVRHTYDLHKLLLQKELTEFLHSSEFDDMLLKVANDDVLSYRNNNGWLIYHPNKAIIFADLENVWSELKAVYNGDFRSLVFGDLPKDDDVLSTLQMIKKRLNACP